MNLCEYVLETLGSEGTLALVRGTPGSIDDQRSGSFADCVTTEGNWEIDSDVLITGWGGTGDELGAMCLGQLWATPMRMADDVGIAAAEIIRADLEGRTDEVPLVFLARISIATGAQGAEEVDAMEAESFRYSGIGTLER